MGKPQRQPVMDMHRSIIFGKDELAVTCGTQRKKRSAQSRVVPLPYVERGRVRRVLQQLQQDGGDGGLRLPVLQPPAAPRVEHITPQRLLQGREEAQKLLMQSVAPPVEPRGGSVMRCLGYLRPSLLPRPPSPAPPVSTPTQPASVDAILRSQVATFAGGTEEEALLLGGRDTGSDVGQPRYPLLHPLSLVEEARDLPAELVAWRTLTAVGVEEVTHALRVGQEEEEQQLKLQQQVQGQQHHHHHSHPHPHPHPRPSGRRWYEQRQPVSQSHRVLASAIKATELNNSSSRSSSSRSSSGGGCGGKSCDSRDSKQRCSDDSSNGSDSGEDDAQRQLERALLARRLLWGNTDSDDEAADDVFWRQTVQRSMKAAAALPQVLPATLAARKRQIWSSVLQRREAHRKQRKHTGFPV